MKKKLKQNQTILLSIIGILILVLSFAYAYMAGIIGDSAKTSVQVLSNLSDKLTFEQGDPISLKITPETLAEGGENVVGSTTSSVKLIANNNTKVAKAAYDVYFEINTNDFFYTTETNEPEIILTIKDQNNNEVYFYDDLTHVTINGISGFDIKEATGNFLAAKEEILTTSHTEGTIHTWSATITFINLDSDQSEIAGSTIQTNLVLKPAKTLAESILENNGGKETIEEKESPSFNAPETTTPGMYAMEDDYGTSYYFRGPVNNNWVYFAGFYWRIVRINGDDSVKLIYSGEESPYENEQVVMTGSKTQIGTKAFNSTSNGGEYTGYMYSSQTHRGYGSSSTIKQELDTWYTNNLKNYEDYLSDFIVCNDRSFDLDSWIPIGLPSVNKYSDAYKRTKTNKIPKLTCSNRADAFTVNEKVKGNGKLTNPIGLLTVDELWLAGATDSDNGVYYLNTGETYWLASPALVTSTLAYNFRITAGGAVDNVGVNGARGVRPVISLSADVITWGDGSYYDPYIVLDTFKFGSRIVLDNGGRLAIEKKGNPDFTEPSTTNEGMYAMKDDYGISYYFRGAVDNNWVYFSSFYWRIVRVNGDGSVKLIYSGTTSPIESEKVRMIGTKTQIGSSDFNSVASKGEHIGFMYTEGTHRGHGTSSTIKQELDAWYNLTLDRYNDYNIQNHIRDFIVCNDRGFITDAWVPIGLPSSTKYSDVYRRTNAGSTPQLMC